MVHRPKPMVYSHIDKVTNIKNRGENYCVSHLTSRHRCQITHAWLSVEEKLVREKSVKIYSNSSNHMFTSSKSGDVPFRTESTVSHST